MQDLLRNLMDSCLPQQNTTFISLSKHSVIWMSWAELKSWHVMSVTSGTILNPSKKHSIIHFVPCDQLWQFTVCPVQKWPTNRLQWLYETTFSQDPLQYCEKRSTIHDSVVCSLFAVRLYYCGRILTHSSLQLWFIEICGLCLYTCLLRQHRNQVKVGTLQHFDSFPFSAILL